MEDIQAVTDGIAAAASHPVVVQVINQGTGIWGNVATGLITGLLTGGITLTGIWLTHHYTLKREKLASEDTRKKELHYIATELVFLLERYAEGCAQVAADGGRENDAREPEWKPEVDYPELELINVSGDWRALNERHLYRLRELLVLLTEARREIAYNREHSSPPFHRDYFRERQYQFTRMGIRAVILAARLRRATGLPDTKLDGNEWSAVSVFSGVWRHKRSLRVAEAATYTE